MKSREEIIEQLLKIHTLAERGVGGEKTSAQEMLAKLMKKYEITEEELFQDKEDHEFFRYKNDTERQILVQVIFSVMGGSSIPTYSTRNKRRVLCIKCTKHQQIEIEMKYSFYLMKFYDDLDIFTQAFCIRNELYSKFGKDENVNDSKEFDLEELFKLEIMAGILDKHTMSKAIEDKSI